MQVLFWRAYAHGQILQLPPQARRGTMMHAWSPDSLRGPRRWFGGDTESTNEGCSHPALQPSRVTTNRLLLMMRLGLAKGWQGRFARSTGAVGVEGNTPDTTALPLIRHETLLPSSVVGLGSFSLFFFFFFPFFSVCTVERRPQPLSVWPSQIIHGAVASRLFFCR
ncbi:uncharacterized protein IWZ02DRAFT_242081 [Phyllosticta citriasiana]|uniref:uncharacterized protein n=1 Tax=Phyllosticta citriasiana TaxID=595635 RepID=UPI0030FDEE54